MSRETGKRMAGGAHFIKNGISPSPKNIGSNMSDFLAAQTKGAVNPAVKSSQFYPGASGPNATGFSDFPASSYMPRKRRIRLNNWKAILIIALAVLLTLTVVGNFIWQSLFVKPRLPNEGSPGGASAFDSSLSASGIDYGDGVRPKAGGARKSQDFYTILLLGRDTGGGGNTDTMLLASYDVTNQKATVMSIPRDTMVNVPWDVKKINSVYNYNGGGENGIQHLYKEIAQLVGFEPDYQIVVEWEAVGKIIDAMGGVWFDVPRNMDYDDPTQDLYIHQKKGYRLLTGNDAMQVLRYRHDNNLDIGYDDGDIGRIRTQQGLLKEMVTQLLLVKNVSKLNQFANVFKECVETDLSLQNILWFAQSAYLGGLKAENVEFVTMPHEEAYCWSPTYDNFQAYVTPLADELLEVVNEKLSPFVEPSHMNELDIMHVNRNGSISSSTGRVEDSRAAQDTSHAPPYYDDYETPSPSNRARDLKPIEPEDIPKTAETENPENPNENPNENPDNSNDNPDNPDENLDNPNTPVITEPGADQNFVTFPNPDLDPSTSSSTNPNTNPSQDPNSGSNPSNPEPSVPDPGSSDDNPGNTPSEPPEPSVTPEPQEPSEPSVTPEPSISTPEPEPSPDPGSNSGGSDFSIPEQPPTE